MPVNFKHGLTQPLFNKNSEEKREKIIKYFNSHNYDIICLNDVPLFKDGLHMNYEGHEMMSEEVLKKIINNDYYNIYSNFGGKIMIIVIAGPTGVGKTKLSIELAKKYNAEIINADSVQVYKKIDIASAKVTEEEKEGIPHHLFDIKEYDEDYTVYD